MCKVKVVSPVPTHQQHAKP